MRCLKITVNLYDLLDKILYAFKIFRTFLLDYLESRITAAGCLNFNFRERKHILTLLTKSFFFSKEKSVTMSLLIDFLVVAFGLLRNLGDHIIDNLTLIKAIMWHNSISALKYRNYTRYWHVSTDYYIYT